MTTNWKPLWTESVLKGIGTGWGVLMECRREETIQDVVYCSDWKSPVRQTLGCQKGLPWRLKSLHWCRKGHERRGREGPRRKGADPCPCPIASCEDVVSLSEYHHIKIPSFKQDPKQNFSMHFFFSAYVFSYLDNWGAPFILCIFNLSCLLRMLTIEHACSSKLSAGVGGGHVRGQGTHSCKSFRGRQTGFLPFHSVWSCTKFCGFCIYNNISWL